jgi:hypothetical protein
MNERYLLELIPLVIVKVSAIHRLFCAAAQHDMHEAGVMM